MAWHDMVSQILIRSGKFIVKSEDNFPLSHSVWSPGSGDLYYHVVFVDQARGEWYEVLYQNVIKLSSLNTGYER